ncbi:hypothetical protein AB0940_33485 [Streptomyces sp. NPDC006656]|uniref:hypothetical protein n=1 Tax=Streptomyces sp. NPDC006656 TaxID=3156899 RepID=UPI003454CA9D
MSGTFAARAAARRRKRTPQAPAEEPYYDGKHAAPKDQEQTAEESARLTREDLALFADRLGAVLAENPEERRHRLHLEREREFEAAGETRVQRRIRHHQEQRDRRHRETALYRVHHSERARRFRRWVLLTSCSASIGFAFGLVQALTGPPVGVAWAVAGAGWVLDWRIRGRGRTRLSEVTGPGIVIAIIVRIPFASGLAAASGLGPLLALSPFAK